MTIASHWAPLIENAVYVTGPSKVSLSGGGRILEVDRTEALIESDIPASVGDLLFISLQVPRRASWDFGHVTWSDNDHQFRIRFSRPSDLVDALAPHARF